MFAYLCLILLQKKDLIQINESSLKEGGDLLS
ncbi:MAG: hypothetical protein ACI917_000313, partial [Patiriisocius sp.]